MTNKIDHCLAATLGLLALMAGAGCGGSAVSEDGGLTPCQSDEQCPLGQFCNNGICAPVPDGGDVCHQDSDCPRGLVCSDGLCVEPGDGGLPDGGDADGGADQAPAVPAIAVEPAVVDFGNGRIGLSVEQQVIVSNAGTGPLTVFSLTLEGGTSPEFGLHPEGTIGAELAPGATFELLVTYSASDGIPDQGAVLISSNDPQQALFRLPLSSSYKGSSEITPVADPASPGPDLVVLDFGPVPVASSARQAVFVKNSGRGNAVLQVEQARVEPAASSNFALQVEPELPTWLSPDPGPCAADSDCPPGHTCQDGACTNGAGRVFNVVKLTVTFTPQTPGQVVERLLVSNDEDDAAGDGLEQPLVITLSGQGTQPALAVTPDPVDFGTLFVGQESTLTVTIGNSGNQQLDIESVIMQSGQAFSLDGAGGGWSLASGEQASISVTYHPGAAGDHLDRLVITSNAPLSPRQVDVLGRATAAPVLEVAPATLDFGQVQLGQVAFAQLSISNAGGSPLRISAIHLADGGSGAFTPLQALLPDIDPGAQDTIDVVFAPQPPCSQHTALLEIASNDPLNPLLQVPLAGQGTDPEVVAEPASVDFGAIYQGYQAGPVAISVRNSGVGTLEVRALGLGAGTEPDFQLQSLPSLPALLEPGQAIGAELYFTPLGTGLRAGTVQVVSDDADHPLLSIPIAGTGTDCPQGWWDVNGDPADGCEYRCDLSNGGVEDCDGQDNDCDALTDEGLTSRTCSVGNQYGTCTGSESCDGANGWIGCDAAVPEPETCDNVDNDCDGATDANDGSLEIPPCEMQLGACAGAVHRIDACQNGFWQPCQDIDYLANNAAYGLEDCDGIDNNCDGQTDEGLTTRSCSVSNQYGTCTGQESCDGTNGWTGCDAAVPEPETCDNADNNCDGLTDAADGTLELAPCELQQGVCAGAVHRAGLCQDGGWQPCQAVDYGPDYGQEVCGNALDEDCSGMFDDKDSDGDGFLDIACGGSDCDDLDPASHPGADEVRDTRDNDCDGLVDEGLVAPGEVIVTEIMKNPAAVNDTYGEYIEVTNVGGEPVNLHSFILRDEDFDSTFINQPAGIVIEPGEAAVLCRNASTTVNGGVACDYDYENFILGQTSGGGDEVVLELDGVVIDRVDYLTDTWPDQSGHAMNLDPAAYDATANDDLSNWCDTPTSDAYKLPSGDWGTPGAFNPTCSGNLAVLAVEPTSGIDAGGETITTVGAGFTGATAVRLDGTDCASFSVVDDTHISCVTPAHAAGDVDVTVERGVNTRTLTSGYRYTAEAPAGTLDWCVLQWPASLTVSAGSPTPLVFGRVYQDGVTPPAGPPAGIGAQVGYGPAGSDPRTSPGWLWFDATWNPSCPDCGNDDEFMRSLTVDVPGSYSYAYRFSSDGGYTFVYADLSPGTSDGFSAANLGSLTVQ